MNKLYGDRLLVAILAQLPSNTLFKSDNIVNAVAEIQKLNKYPILDDVAIDRDGIDLKSDRIESALNSLRETRLITCFDQTTNAINIRFERFIKPDLNQEELQMIKNLAEDIWRIL